MDLLILAMIVALLWFYYKLARKEAIFIPLSQETIDKMLKAASIKRNDVLYDLGSGDGRVLITAARRYGIKAVGIEKSRLLFWISKKRVERKGLQNKIKLINGDFFDQNISKASVVVMYLSQKINDRLVPKLKRELKKGTRIVSANHQLKIFREIKHVKTGHFHSYLYKK